MTRTLYVSDLDGTLLGEDGTLSPRTASVVNDLIDGGGLFTYATARSFTSASAATAGLRLNLPAITYGGSAVIDPRTGELASATFLPATVVTRILRLMSRADGVEPFVFGMVDGQDRAVWREAHANDGVRAVLDALNGDPRLLSVAGWSDIDPAQVLSIGTGGSAGPLREVRDALGDALEGCFSVLWDNDGRPGRQWLEIYSADATKAAAARRLQARVGADRLVAFGDHLNDVPLLAGADAGYAVANAVPELRAVATSVIGSNGDHGVAEWLAEFGR
ncbi:MAG: Cof-type HAD-IIB family hydrolase [Streptosporangiales bacterium]|nr:Cof-type HAD-IIB family hydrolase [Streptosporangiales bacterium]